MTSSIGNVASVAAHAGGTVVRQVRGYRMFKDKEDGCVRAVFRPGA